MSFNILSKLIKSFGFAWEGLKTTWREESSFRFEVGLSAIVILAIFFFQFSFLEAGLCLIGLIFVLSAEIINTIIEDLCNKIEFREDPIIRKIKDMAAGLVLVSVLGSLVLGFLVFYNHFML